MNYNLFKTKIKKYLIGIFINNYNFVYLFFLVISTIVREGYDQQNKLIEITKSIIPKSLY